MTNPSCKPDTSKRPLILLYKKISNNLEKTDIIVIGLYISISPGHFLLSLITGIITPCLKSSSTCPCLIIIANKAQNDDKLWGVHV